MLLSLLFLLFTLSACTLSLSGGGTEGGNVDFAGVTVDRENNLLAEVEILLYRSDLDPILFPDSIHRSKSDESGRFNLRKLPKGQYRVQSITSDSSLAYLNTLTIDRDISNKEINLEATSKIKIALPPQHSKNSAHCVLAGTRWSLPISEATEEQGSPYRTLVFNNVPATTIDSIIIREDSKHIRTIHQGFYVNETEMFIETTWGEEFLHHIESMEALNEVDTIWTVYSFDEENLYIGGSSGLINYNPITGEVDWIENLPAQSVTSLNSSTTGELIVGTRTGAFIKKGVEWTKIDLFGASPIYSLEYDKDGMLWAGRGSLSLIGLKNSGKVEIPSESFNYSNIHGIDRWKDGLIVYSDDETRLYAINNGIPTEIELPHNGRTGRGISACNNHIYYATVDKIFFYNGGSWEIIPHLLDEEEIRQITYMSATDELIVITSRRLWSYKGSTITGLYDLPPALQGEDPILIENRDSRLYILEKNNLFSFFAQPE